MKFLFDYFPIIAFFVAFKLWGIYVATAVAMATSFLQLLFFWLRHRRFEKAHIITFVFILVLGGSTLIFHNPIFIKWKPTIVYWAFSVLLMGSQWFTSKTLLHRMLSDKINLSLKIWARLNTSWALFFLVLGAVNLYVVYNFDTNTWVNFKLFGTLALMILFIVGQAFYISRHAQHTKETS